MKVRELKVKKQLLNRSSHLASYKKVMNAATL